MKVLFIEDVIGTADAGEVKEVKNGFARNYLLPRGMAVSATPRQLQRLGAIQRAAGEKRQKQTGVMSKVAEGLEGTTLTMEFKVGPMGRLYGAVSSRRIAEELSKLTGQEMDHRNIQMAEAIRAPGDYPVTVRLYREVTAQIRISVVPEGYSQEQAAKAAAGETAEPDASQEGLEEPESPPDLADSLLDEEQATPAALPKEKPQKEGPLETEPKQS